MTTRKNFTESWKNFKGLENFVLNRKCMWWLTFEIKIRINNYFPPCRALCILRCRFNEHHFVKERFKNSFFDDAGHPPFARINLLNHPPLPKFIKTKFMKTKCITEIEWKLSVSLNQLIWNEKFISVLSNLLERNSKNGNNFHHFSRNDFNCFRYEQLSIKIISC